MIGKLSLEQAEINRIFSQDDTMGCLGMSEMSFISSSGKRGADFSRNLNIMTCFKQESSQCVGESTIIQIKVEAQGQRPGLIAAVFLPQLPVQPNLA